MIVFYLNMLESEEDREVCGKLYEDKVQSLFRAARRLVINEQDAEDAVQTGFLKLVERFGHYRGQSRACLEHLIYTAVINAAKDIARDYKKKAYFDEEVIADDRNPALAVPGVLEFLISRHEAELVRQAVMELGEEERAILQLQKDFGMKPKAIGKFLKLPPEVVRRKIFYAKRKLAKILEGEKYEELR